MRILLVGALSWNPERIRSLCEQGHTLWGLWARSMAWDQGPYDATDDCVVPVAFRDAGATIRAERIDCVYSLFQSYRPELWGAKVPGVEHDVWTLLRGLLHERADGVFDVPIVRHWGFDVHSLDVDVARALDGHLFCNREKLDYLSRPRAQGGGGLGWLGDDPDPRFLDSDLPKREFMNDRFALPLSERQGEIHTVCVGRPFGIDFLAAARHGIHVHVYCNSVDDVYSVIASQIRARGARRSLGRLRRYLHVREPRQTIGLDWSEVRRTKSLWVQEFSRYDAAWSYIGTPFRWTTLDDRAAIPNRLGTYLLAGLPVITDRRDQYYRYEQLRRLGVEIELTGSDYDGLRGRLQTEIRTREKRQHARERRATYSFDATIEPLLSALEQVRERYFARARSERSRFVPRTGGGLVHLSGKPGPRPAREHPALLPSRWRSCRLARRLRSDLDLDVRGDPALPER
jgi:hypothetical protein